MTVSELITDKTFDEIVSDAVDGLNSPRYVDEVLGGDDDNGTMPENRDLLAEAVVGHKIVSVTQNGGSAIIHLDNGKRVRLAEGGDCCAFTMLESFLLHPDKVDHVITGVGTTNGYRVWHVYADMGDVLALTVGWSAGNPFYYGYGFDITVEDDQ